MKKIIWIFCFVVVIVLFGGVYFIPSQKSDPEYYLDVAEKLLQDGKYNEALKNCLEAERSVKKLKQTHSEMHGLVLLKLGKISCSLNNSGDLRKYSMDAKDIFKALGQERGIIVADINIGKLAFQHENYAESIYFLQEALDLDSKLHYLTTYNRCHPLWYLAISYFRLGQYSKAKTEFSKSLGLISEVYGKNSTEHSRNYNYLGDCCLYTKDISMARESFQSALDILLKNYPNNHKGLTSNYWGLAKCCYQNHDLKNAERYARKALDYSDHKDPLHVKIEKDLKTWLNN